MQVFQFKLLHRVLPCNHNLKLWKKRPTTMCFNCICPDDTIEHMMLNCRVVKGLWTWLKDRYCDVKGIEIELTIENCLLGLITPNSSKRNKLKWQWNWLAMQLKYFIYSMHQQNKPPKLIIFIRALHATFNIIQAGLSTKREKESFEEHWRPWVEVLLECE